MEFELLLWIANLFVGLHLLSAILDRVELPPPFAAYLLTVLIHCLLEDLSSSGRPRFVLFPSGPSYYSTI